MRLAELYGLARSLLLYYALPGRTRGWQRLYSGFVKEGDLCFDIGAHVGNRTRALRALGARVVCVEPQPRFAAILRRFFDKDKAVSVLEQAIGASRREAEMLLSSRTPNVSSLSAEWVATVSEREDFNWVDWDLRHKVQMTTLDRLIEEFGPAVFCKLDIEGYEAETLQGLSNPIPYISFEYLPAAIEVAQQALGRLVALGVYEFNWVVGERPKLALDQWVGLSKAENYLTSLLPDERAGEIYARTKTDHA